MNTIIEGNIMIGLADSIQRFNDYVSYYNRRRQMIYRPSQDKIDFVALNHSVSDVIHVPFVTTDKDILLNTIQESSDVKEFSASYKTLISKIHSDKFVAHILTLTELDDDMRCSLQASANRMSEELIRLRSTIKNQLNDHVQTSPDTVGASSRPCSKASVIIGGTSSAAASSSSAPPTSTSVSTFKPKDTLDITSISPDDRAELLIKNPKSMLPLLAKHTLLYFTPAQWKTICKSESIIDSDDLTKTIIAQMPLDSFSHADYINIASASVTVWHETYPIIDSKGIKLTSEQVGLLLLRHCAQKSKLVRLISQDLETVDRQFCIHLFDSCSKYRAHWAYDYFLTGLRKDHTSLYRTLCEHFSHLETERKKHSEPRLPEPSESYLSRIMLWILDPRSLDESTFFITSVIAECREESIDASPEGVLVRIIKHSLHTKPVPNAGLFYHYTEKEPSAKEVFHRNPVMSRLLNDYEVLLKQIETKDMFALSKFLREQKLTPKSLLTDYTSLYTLAENFSSRGMDGDQVTDCISQLLAYITPPTDDRLKLTQGTSSSLMLGYGPEPTGLPTRHDPKAYFFSFRVNNFDSYGAKRALYSIMHVLVKFPSLWSSFNLDSQKELISSLSLHDPDSQRARFGINTQPIFHSFLNTPFWHEALAASTGHFYRSCRVHSGVKVSDALTNYPVLHKAYCDGRVIDSIEKSQNVSEVSHDQVHHAKCMERQINTLVSQTDLIGCINFKPNPARLNQWSDEQADNCIQDLLNQHSDPQHKLIYAFLAYQFSCDPSFFEKDGTINEKSWKRFKEGITSGTFMNCLSEPSSRLCFWYLLSKTRTVAFPGHRLLPTIQDSTQLPTLSKYQLLRYHISKHDWPQMERQLIVNQWLTGLIIEIKEYPGVLASIEPLSDQEHTFFESIYSDYIHAQNPDCLSGFLVLPHVFQLNAVRDRFLRTVTGQALAFFDGHLASLTDEQVVSACKHLMDIQALSAMDLVYWPRIVGLLRNASICDTPDNFAGRFLRFCNASHDLYAKLFSAYYNHPTLGWPSTVDGYQIALLHQGLASLIGYQETLAAIGAPPSYPYHDNHFHQDHVAMEIRTLSKEVLVLLRSGCLTICDMHHIPNITFSLWGARVTIDSSAPLRDYFEQQFELLEPHQQALMVYKMMESFIHDTRQDLTKSSKTSQDVYDTYKRQLSEHIQRIRDSIVNHPHITSALRSHHDDWSKLTKDCSYSLSTNSFRVMHEFIRALTETQAIPPDAYFNPHLFDHCILSSDITNRVLGPRNLTEEEVTKFIGRYLLIKRKSEIGAVSNVTLPTIDDIFLKLPANSAQARAIRAHKSRLNNLDQDTLLRYGLYDVVIELILDTNFEHFTLASCLDTLLNDHYLNINQVGRLDHLLGVMTFWSETMTKCEVNRRDIRTYIDFMRNQLFNREISIEIPQGFSVSQRLALYDKPPRLLTHYLRVCNDDQKRTAFESFVQHLSRRSQSLSRRDGSYLIAFMATGVISFSELSSLDCLRTITHNMLSTMYEHTRGHVLANHCLIPHDSSLSDFVHLTSQGEVLAIYLLTQPFHRQQFIKALSEGTFCIDDEQSASDPISKTLFKSLITTQSLSDSDDSCINSVMQTFIRQAKKQSNSDSYNPSMASLDQWIDLRSFQSEKFKVASYQTSIWNRVVYNLCQYLNIKNKKPFAYDRWVVNILSMLCDFDIRTYIIQVMTSSKPSDESFKQMIFYSLSDPSLANKVTASILKADTETQWACATAIAGHCKRYPHLRSIQHRLLSNLLEITTEDRRDLSVRGLIKHLKDTFIGESMLVAAVICAFHACIGLVQILLGGYGANHWPLILSYLLSSRVFYKLSGRLTPDEYSFSNVYTVFKHKMNNTIVSSYGSFYSVLKQIIQITATPVVKVKMRRCLLLLGHTACLFLLTQASPLYTLACASLFHAFFFVSARCYKIRVPVEFTDVTGSSTKGDNAVKCLGFVCLALAHFVAAPLLLQAGMLGYTCVPLLASASLCMRFAYLALMNKTPVTRTLSLDRVLADTPLIAQLNPYPTTRAVSHTNKPRYFEVVRLCVKNGANKAWRFISLFSPLNLYRCTLEAMVRASRYIQKHFRRLFKSKSDATQYPKHTPKPIRKSNLHKIANPPCHEPQNHSAVKETFTASAAP
ncbi:MAG: hypothetical protein VXY77_04210 [Pseudomonadota bacterium]|nr:hypothetical protein [Pseudomonadota bacterium]